MPWIQRSIVYPSLQITNLGELAFSLLFGINALSNTCADMFCKDLDTSLLEMSRDSAQ